MMFKKKPQKKLYVVIATAEHEHTDGSSCPMDGKPVEMIGPRAFEADSPEDAERIAKANLLEGVPKVLKLTVRHMKTFELPPRLSKAMARVHKWAVKCGMPKDELVPDNIPQIWVAYRELIDKGKLPPDLADEVQAMVVEASVKLAKSEGKRLRSGKFDPLASINEARLVSNSISNFMRREVKRRGIKSGDVNHEIKFDLPTGG